MKNCILKRIFFIISLLTLILIPAHLINYYESIGVIVWLHIIWMGMGILFVYSLTNGSICPIDEKTKHDWKYINEYPDFVEHI